MRVTNILRDSNDRIWVSTANSVYSFSANASGNIENINTYQVAGENRSFYFNRHSAALLDYSRVAFGGSDGLRIFAGNRVYQRRMTLPLVFTDFKVHNRSLRQMPEAERTQIADKDIAYASMITLDHHQNNFSIDFFGSFVPLAHRQHLPVPARRHGYRFCNRGLASSHGFLQQSSGRNLYLPPPCGR